MTALGRCCRKSISRLMGQIFPRPWRVRRAQRCTRKRPQGFVHVLTRLAEARKPENGFLRDFSDRAIFHFFDSIGQKRSSTARLDDLSSYVLKNCNEFFAVTGSLYLWNKVAIPPHERHAVRQAGRAITSG